MVANPHGKYLLGHSHWDAYVFGAALVNQGKWTPDARQALRYASERHPEAKMLLAKWPARSPVPTHH